MFAGPNGSGKSTIKAKIGSINPRWLGVEVNPDEIEAAMRRDGSLDLSRFSIKLTQSSFAAFVERSLLWVRALDNSASSPFVVKENRLLFDALSVNSYHASVISDLIRQKLLAGRASFSFETVLSSPDKLDFLRKASRAGYRVYLYYVATDDPLINISRVKSRVRKGGHDVPTDKIVARYRRSLDALLGAIDVSHRAYLFDNSGIESKLIAEVNDGELRLVSSSIPNWFDRFVLRKLGG